MSSRLHLNLQCTTTIVKSSNSYPGYKKRPNKIRPFIFARGRGRSSNQNIKQFNLVSYKQYYHNTFQRLLKNIL